MRCHAHTIRKTHRKTIVSDVFVHDSSLSTASTGKKKKSKELNCVVKHKKLPKGAKASHSIPSPSPTSTYAPTKSSSKGLKGSSYCPTIISACSLWELGQAEFGSFSYVMDMKLAIDEPAEDVLEELQAFLNEELSQELAACADFDVRRRLQDTNIMKLELSVTEDTTSPCSVAPVAADCLQVDVTMKVTHDEGDANVIRDSILQKVTDRCQDIRELDGVVETFDPCPFINITVVDNVSDVTPGEGGASAGDGGDSDGSNTGGESDEGDGSSSTGGGSSGSDGGDSSGGDGTSGSAGSDSSGSGGEDGSTGGGGDGTSGSTSGADGEDEDDGADGTEDDKGIALIVDTQTSEEKKIRAPGYIFFAMSGVVLIILLLLLVRRRREYYNATKHKHFIGEPEDETDTYIKDSDEDSLEQRGRQVHVVGEADSVFSGWSDFTGGDRRSRGNTGLYPEDYNGSLDESYQNQDVHQCSSATCELCESRRRAGIQFVPSKMPSHSSTLPIDAPRHYLTEDTVQL